MKTQVTSLIGACALLLNSTLGICEVLKDGSYNYDLKTGNDSFTFDRTLEGPLSIRHDGRTADVEMIPSADKSFQIWVAPIKEVPSDARPGKVTIDVAGGSATIGVTPPTFAKEEEQEYPTRIEISVPNEFLGDTYVKTNSGNLKMKSFPSLDKDKAPARKVHLKTHAGAIYCKNVSASGGIQLETKSANIVASENEGNMTATSRSGKISIPTHKKGNVNASSPFGSVDSPVISKPVLENKRSEFAYGAPSQHTFNNGSSINIGSSSAYAPGGTAVILPPIIGPNTRANGLPPGVTINVNSVQGYSKNGTAVVIPFVSN